MLKKINSNLLFLGDTMSIKSDIIALLLTDESIMIAAPMSDEMKKQVLKLEMKRLEELVPFINEGMEEAFEEEISQTLLRDATALVFIGQHAQSNTAET